MRFKITLINNVIKSILITHFIYKNINFFLSSLIIFNDEKVITVIFKFRERI